MTTISYVSGGKLGDFIQQMSIIYERFLTDRIPAILYISDRGDTFRLGVEQAFTDLQPLVTAQPYIKEFKIYNGEPYDVDLSSWRKYVSQTPLENYLMWMKKEYNVEWGKHRWVCEVPTNHEWKDKIVVNTTRYRFPDKDDWLMKLRHYPKDKLVFVGFDNTDYRDFMKRTRIKPHFHQPSSLWDLVIIIHSCSLFIGSLSAPLSIALGLHTPCHIGFFGTKTNHFDYQVFHNIQKNIPNRQYITHSHVGNKKQIIPSDIMKHQKDCNKRVKMPLRLQKYLTKKK